MSTETTKVLDRESLMLPTEPEDVETRLQSLDFNQRGCTNSRSDRSICQPSAKIAKGRTAVRPFNVVICSINP